MLQAYEFALDKVGLDFNSYQVYTKCFWQHFCAT